MTTGAGSLRNRIVNAGLGVELQALLLGFQDSLQRLEAAQADRQLKEAQNDLDASYIRRRLEAELVGLRQDRDDVPSLKAFLATLRKTREYNRAWADSNPLVSVRVASYINTQQLMEITIPSVLAQTYQNFEIVIVNDGPNERTRRAILAVGDSRICYEEFPTRRVYPTDPHARWMVAGSPGMNRAAELARGAWIAPLDDDDSFTPDHIEKLLRLAIAERAELAYGALVQKNLANGENHRIYSAPPAISQFSFQGAIYLAMLHPTFRYDEASWLVEEPGDWNLIRRMLAAGVTMAATPDVVAEMNQIPFTHKQQESRA